MKKIKKQTMAKNDKNQEMRAFDLMDINAEKK